ncbi:hypothetical protein DSM03_11119 [Leeuwenhoekiella aestuarii]|uniref:Uncharacterized protein n=1 Tax=Leeuwenhoekiella aestuarii TaxID=2249426 RepID=A0A4Q0NNC4_9FLAO|nr:hypothetical protein DSM04_11119 [Leeuwenhoekiella aestuarii]RXG12145.1 hypothetical protein DSM03_11119 [Leeuwenhoekiella aestuarii]
MNILTVDFYLEVAVEQLGYKSVLKNDDNALKKRELTSIFFILMYLKMPARVYNIYILTSALSFVLSD